MNKERYHSFLSGFIIFLLVLSFVIDFPFLRLIAIAMMCGIMLFSSLDMATCHMFFFSSFYRILTYGGYVLFIFVAISYMLAAFFKKSIEKGVIIFVFSAFAFFVFGSSALYGSEFKIGDMIPLLMLMQIIFICNVAKPSHYEKYTNWFVIGFLISAVVGLFINNIPALQEVLRTNRIYMYDNSTYSFYTLDRYAGLAFDSNFFGLITCFVVSVLLFRKPVENKKMYMIIAVFLLILGFSTISKSYMFMMALVCFLYILQSDQHFIKRIVFVLFVILIYCIIDFVYELGYVASVFKRFSQVKDMDSLTTHRSTIWLGYLEYIFLNGSTIVLGDGFNSSTIGIAAHNTYLEMLYYFGAFGIFLWCKYFQLCYNKIKSKIVGMKIYTTKVPLFVLLVYIFFLSAMSVPSLAVIICVLFFNMNMPDNKDTISESLDYRS